MVVNPIFKLRTILLGPVGLHPTPFLGISPYFLPIYLFNWIFNNFAIYLFRFIPNFNAPVIWILNWNKFPFINAIYCKHFKISIKILNYIISRTCNICRFIRFCFSLYSFHFFISLFSNQFSNTFSIFDAIFRKKYVDKLSKSFVIFFCHRGFCNILSHFLLQHDIFFKFNSLPLIMIYHNRDKAIFLHPLK